MNTAVAFSLAAAFFFVLLKPWSLREPEGGEAQAPI
jgi:hypothetical protein